MLILTMKSSTLALLFLLCMFLNVVNCSAFVKELINLAYKVMDDYYYKCEDQWHTKDTDGLFRKLQKELFGQPLVFYSVYSSLLAHLRESVTPSKPLVLSFHGWPGSGKNHVADFIIDYIFKQGRESRNVHYYKGKIDFPMESKVEHYQQDLIWQISRSVKDCPHSIFVFDEVDKIPPGVLDAVKPFLDYRQSVHGVDYRRAIFLFLSNIGGTEIVERTIELWKQGKIRDHFEMRDFEGLLSTEAFNQGGFLRSHMIESHLVDHYVPFLPLEKSHVIQCIEVECRRQSIHFTSRLAEEVIDNLLFGPYPEQLYSVAGCKRISQLVPTIGYRLGLRIQSIGRDEF